MLCWTSGIRDADFTKYVGQLNSVYGPPLVFGICEDQYATMRVNWKNESFEGSFNMTVRNGIFQDGGT